MSSLWLWLLLLVADVMTGAVVMTGIIVTRAWVVVVAALTVVKLVMSVVSCAH